MIVSATGGVSPMSKLESRSSDEVSAFGVKFSLASNAFLDVITVGWIVMLNDPSEFPLTARIRIATTRVHVEIVEGCCRCGVAIE